MLITLVLARGAGPVICGDPRVPIPLGWNNSRPEDRDRYCGGELSLLKAQDLGLPNIEPTIVIRPTMVPLTNEERAEILMFVLSDAEARLAGKRFQLYSVGLSRGRGQWDMRGACGQSPRCAEVKIFNYTDNEGLEYLIRIDPALSILKTRTGQVGWPLSIEEQSLAREIARYDPTILKEIRTKGLIPEPLILAQAHTKSGSCVRHRCVLVTFKQRDGDLELLVFVDLNEERVSDYLFSGTQ